MREGGEGTIIKWGVHEVHYKYINCLHGLKKMDVCDSSNPRKAFGGLNYSSLWYEGRTEEM